MKPRILLLMASDERSRIRSVLEDCENFTLVGYDGYFTPDSVKEYLKGHEDEFDAVAVFSLRHYAAARKAMEEIFTGPKILLHTAKDYEPAPGQYVFEVELGQGVTQSKFDKLVEQHFKNLSQN